MNIHPPGACNTTEFQSQNGLILVPLIITNYLQWCQFQSQNGLILVRATVKEIEKIIEFQSQNGLILVNINVWDCPYLD